MTKTRRLITDSGGNATLIPKAGLSIRQGGGGVAEWEGMGRGAAGQGRAGQGRGLGGSVREGGRQYDRMIEGEESEG